ncbi:MAG: hypothetical protein ACRETH_10755 [Steroidobacteraceae bacterium]
MLASYLSDIEQLLDEQQWEAASREALDLPQIAVALSDPQLSASSERIKAWCDEWIRPQDPDRNARGADYERVSKIVPARAAHDESATVPSLALRRLRLRRLARTPPRGFNAGRSGTLDPEGSNAVETCSILVESARRWYAQSACHDQTVQANLARLAVLR